MCGRFVQATPPSVLAEHFAVDEVAVEEHAPDYNVTPREVVPVVRVRAADGARVLSSLRWGLVPSWAKDPGIGDRLVNARAETLATTPSFRRAFAKRRCLVPADGFYEWRPGTAAGAGKPRKQPYFIRRRDGEPLALAGLWEVWRNPEVADDDAPDAWLRTFVIVTTGANAVLAPIHDRMPVLLAPDAWDEWLDPQGADPAALARLLVPAPDDVLEAYPVGTRVNRPGANDPDLVRQVERMEA